MQTSRTFGSCPAVKDCCTAYGTSQLAFSAFLEQACCSKVVVSCVLVPESLARPALLSCILPALPACCLLSNSGSSHLCVTSTADASWLLAKRFVVARVAFCPTTVFECLPTSAPVCACIVPPKSRTGVVVGLMRRTQEEEKTTVSTWAAL